MSFVGLVPSERSSGEGRRQGSITKAGSVHTRWLLVEAARNSRGRPTVGYELARRQRRPGPRGPRARVALPAATASALAADGRPRRAHKKIAVACARELAGFLGAIATDHPLSTT
jgi:transposase